MLLALPIRNVTLDELQPKLAIETNELGRVDLKLMLKHNC